MINDDKYLFREKLHLYMQDWILRIVDEFTNRILVGSTFLAVALLVTKIWYPSMHNAVEEFVATCLVYQKKLKKE